MRRRAVLVLAATLCAAPALTSEARAAAPGLVAAYAFEEGSGTTSADRSGNQQTATLRDATWTTSGRYGRALSFDGISSMVRVADSAALDLSKGMTVEAWVRPDSSVSGARTIVTKSRVGGGFPYGLELEGGRPEGFADVGGKSMRAVARKSISTGTWRFLATTYNGSVIRTYLNGTKVAETAATGTISVSADALEIGGNSVWGERFKGAIDNVRIYSRALSDRELDADRSADVAADAPAPTPAPSPTPTPTPSPTPAPSGNNCMPDPSACGFPDRETVGVQSGVNLTPVSGTVTLSTPGQVYENKFVTGSIVVTAPNVTIRNVKLVNTNPYYGISVKNANSWENDRANLLLDHVEINLGGGYTVKGIAFNGYTARNVFFHNGSDCAHFGRNVLIEESLCVSGPDTDNDGWPDGSAFCSGPDHFDGFQSDGGSNITIRHNTLRNPCSQTSNILLSSNTSHISTVTMTNNLLAGGGYSMYCAGMADRSSVDHIVATNNRFARTWYSRGGYWGPTAYCEYADVSTGNVWDDTGLPVG